MSEKPTEPPRALVGGRLRPGRWVTLGRRRSDRAAYWAMAGLSVLCAAFVARTSYQLDQLHQQIESTVNECRRAP